MPKQVDHEGRRRAIAEAVFEVIGGRGYEAVSLRDVARAAGVSMGMVQHYFTSKNEMLLFALAHMRARVLARLEAEQARLAEPDRRALLRTGLRVLLPLDEPSRQEAIVNIAFFSAATVTPEYASVLREGYARLLEATRVQFRAAAAAGELAPRIDPDREAEALFFVTQGLIGPVLIGQVSSEEALAILDHHLDRVFR